MEESKTCLNNKRERNFQKRDYNRIYRSNSQQHYKNISNCNYENRIRLNPSGEYESNELSASLVILPSSIVLWIVP